MAYQPKNNLPNPPERQIYNTNNDYSYIDVSDAQNKNHSMEDPDTQTAFEQELIILKKKEELIQNFQTLIDKAETVSKELNKQLQKTSSAKVICVWDEKQEDTMIKCCEIVTEKHNNSLLEWIHQEERIKNALISTSKKTIESFTSDMKKAGQEIGEQVATDISKNIQEQTRKSINESIIITPMTFYIMICYVLISFVFILFSTILRGYHDNLFKIYDAIDWFEKQDGAWIIGLLIIIIFAPLVFFSIKKELSSRRN